MKHKESVSFILSLVNNYNKAVMEGDTAHLNYRVLSNAISTLHSESGLKIQYETLNDYIVYLRISDSDGFMVEPELYIGRNQNIANRIEEKVLQMAYEVNNYPSDRAYLRDFLSGYRSALKTLFALDVKITGDDTISKVKFSYTTHTTMYNYDDSSHEFIFCSREEH